MNKKKNTLQDLDDFLKQQAASFVAPATLSENTVASLPSLKNETEETSPEVSLEEIFEDIKGIANKDDSEFRKKLYSLIIQSLETQKNPSPEDKMLINTVLYLKSGTEWKTVIREYWRSR